MPDSGTPMGSVPWKSIITVTLVIIVVLIFKKEIGQILLGVQEAKFGEFSIKTAPPIIKLAVSSSAYDMAAASSLSAYKIQVQDRDALLDTVRYNVDPVFIKNKIHDDAEVCKVAKSAAEQFEELCSAEVQKELKRFMEMITKLEPKLRTISNAKDQIPLNEVNEVSDALRIKEPEYSRISYYYLIMGALETLKTYKSESVLPVFLSGLGKIPRSAALNYLIGWTLVHSSARGGPLASMYFLEQAYSTQVSYKRTLSSINDTCPMGRYEESEAQIANFIAWVMALEGLREYREDAERYIHVALTGVSSLKEKARKVHNLGNCVKGNIGITEIAFLDTQGYIKLRFADDSADIEGKEGALAILEEALKKAHSIHEEEYEAIIDQHIKEARTRAKFLHVLELLEKSVQK